MRDPWESPAPGDAVWLDFNPKDYDEFRRCLLGACRSMFRGAGSTTPAVRMDGLPPFLLLEIKSLGPGCDSLEINSILDGIPDPKARRRTCQMDLFLRIPITPHLDRRASTLVRGVQEQYLAFGTPDPPDDLIIDLYKTLMPRPGTLTRQY